MRRGRQWGRAAAVLAAVLAADQLTKHLVRESIGRGEEKTLVPGVVELVHVRNDGVAFGLDVGGSTLVVVLIALALLGLVLSFARHVAKPLLWLPVGLLFGGAIGNIIDRVRDGAVTDFIKLPAWPAFNVADMAITFGVVILLFVLERRDGRDPRPA